MVGALADWFAVTALFRHPLGIPIPHTAIVPHNKDRIGAALGDFVQTNFLSAEVLGRKLTELQIGARLGDWLQEEESSRRASDQLVRIISDLLGSIDDSDIRAFLRQNLNELRKEVRYGAVLSALLKALMHGDNHQQVLNEALLVGERLLDRHQGFLREALRNELPWYVPNFVHDKVYADTVRRLKETVHAINRDPGHPARAVFSDYITRLIVTLRTSQVLEQRCQEGVRWLLESEEVAAYAYGAWSTLRSSVQDSFGAGSPRAAEGVKRGLNALGRALQADVAVRAKLDQAVIASARRFAEGYKAQIAALVTDTVRLWDASTIVDKIEQHVSRDLQYIRINGTLVGGLVGILIYASKMLIP